MGPGRGWLFGAGAILCVAIVYVVLPFEADMRPLRTLTSGDAEQSVPTTRRSPAFRSAWQSEEG